MKKAGYVHNVDELIDQTSLDEVLVHFGQNPTNLTSGEYRMNCVFNQSCQDSSYGQLAIGVNHPAKQIFCHACGTRGNLLTLIHGLEHHCPPETGKLRGQEFKNALRKLQEIRGLVNETRTKASETLTGASKSPAANQSIPEKADAKPKRHVPLHRHENEGARKIANLYQDLIVEPSEMSPAAAQYVRSRPWMTPEVMAKWGIGYLPKDGRSMFRGLFVYTHRNEQGEPISYSARDPLFEEKQTAWLRHGNPKAPKKPIKHKYVKGYARGLELYGQQASRMEDDQLSDSLKQHGLIIVEGANDVIALDAIGLAAVGLCGNRATEQQISKIERFARNAANGRVTLMPDNDEEGEAGFKELLWQLVDRGLQVQLAWSRTRENGRFDGQQPESISRETWESIAHALAT